MLTAVEVARWLRLSAGTVTRWARLHEDSYGAEGLPGFKAMGQWRFHAAEVQAWLERQAEKPERRPPGEVRPIRLESAATTPRI
ncbi:MAG: helix-turn-helix domain-containing protein [Bryobacterales bacterium]|nr:helix-turn-helix domain-containing protein [Bryobacterales bacterium]